MPEHAEVRIMSDFVNSHSKDKLFTKLYHVHRGNIPQDSELIENFKIDSLSNGKELILKLDNGAKKLNISVFMGMTGNWKIVKTENWNETKFIRMRIDSFDGYSLILYGAYMGPKYRLNGFTGVKRGPDPLTNFTDFEKNILDNLDKLPFKKPIAEVLLNQKYFNGVGAYLTAEILGRFDKNPHTLFNTLSTHEVKTLTKLVNKCCHEAYEYGGGELLDWDNPFGKGSIDDWIKFYGNKTDCIKAKFGSRNIWIQKKWV